MKKTPTSLIICCALLISILSSCGEKTKDDTIEPDKTELGKDTAFIKKITFPSLDGLQITAVRYHIDSTKPIIILCHQAGYSRGEYEEIAPKLNDLGFNCIALDQRSGNKINGVINETAALAKSKGLGQSFMDAEQDVKAAIDLFSNTYHQKIILWGSSYSSSLALIIAAGNDKVEKVLSFSPGEYLKDVQVAERAKEIDMPAFLTSAKNEQSTTKVIFDKIKSTTKTHFIPTGTGRHGSSCLWSSEADNAEYWVAVKAFLGV